MDHQENLRLTKQAASGVKWSTLSQGSRQGIQFITSVVLARLLSPSDFGLIGMAMILIGFVSLFKDLGTSSAVIQQQKPTEKLLSSLFWANVLFGLLTMIVLFLLAPATATFFKEPRLASLIRVFSSIFFVSSLSILQQSLLERDLAFDRLAKVEIVATLIGSVVSVGLAVWGWGVYSLVYQSLVMTAVTTILLWYSSPWRPGMIFCWAEVKAVSKYSLNLTGFNIFNYFIRNADNLLIGRFLGAQSLGYYALAYRIMLYPIQTFYSIVGRVMFPLFSQIQSDDERFKKAYLRMVVMISLVTFPLMLGLLVTCRPFVLCVFGQKWSPIILLLAILSPVGLVQSVGTTVGVIYQAKGRTDWMFRWGVAIGIIVMAAFVIGLRWGIIGVAAAYAVVSMTVVYPNFAIPFKLIHLRVLDLMKVLSRPFFASLIMAAVVAVIHVIVPTYIGSFSTLVILVTAGVLSYLPATWFMNRSAVTEVQNIFNIYRVKSDSSNRR